MTKIITIKDNLYSRLKTLKGDMSFSWVIEEILIVAQKNLDAQYQTHTPAPEQEQEQPQDQAQNPDQA